MRAVTHKPLLAPAKTAVLSYHTYSFPLSLSVSLSLFCCWYLPLAVQVEIETQDNWDQFISQEGVGGNSVASYSTHSLSESSVDNNVSSSSLLQTHTY